MTAATTTAPDIRKAGFFVEHLESADPEIFSAIRHELHRQQTKIELIASENVTSLAVLEATGSIFTNKYAEGYPGKRYYGGCEYADVVENLAIERAKALFGCEFANVQPNSGGHLTHGSPVNMSGKWFHPIPYGVRADDHRIDMDNVAALAREHKPKLIIAGGTAYSREWDWAAFRAIADEVGAYLLVDMSHISGLVAGGAHSSPMQHAHVVTSTTHKSLRGPRSGIILTNDEALAKKFNMAVFPGLQGGPMVHTIAAKAVAFGEALRPEFKAYAHQVVANAKALAASLQDHGMAILSGGTDNHLMLADLSPKDVTGKSAEKGLDRAWLTCNKNGVPFDKRSPFVTSGIRLGTPAATTRGFREDEFRIVGQLIAEVVEGLARNGDEGDGQVEQRVRDRVADLCAAYPIYPEM